MGKGSSAFLQGTSLQVMRQEAATKVIQRHVAQEKYINPHKPGFRKKQYNYPWMEDGNQWWSSTSAERWPPLSSRVDLSLPPHTLVAF